MDGFSDVVVDRAKLEAYCLSDTHPRGRHKARVFRAKLGLTASDADAVRQRLLEAVRDRPTDLRPAGTDQYGQRYVLDVPMSGPAGSAVVRSAWIVRSGEDVLRFLSCFVL